MPVQPSIEQIEILLNHLNEACQRFYDCRSNPQGCYTRRSNYEDLAFLAAQAEEAASLERDNPALEPFLFELESQFKIDREGLWELLNESINLIRDLVERRLSLLKPVDGHLACVIDAALERTSQLPILTLNHDCLIEAAFYRRRVGLNDLLKQDAPGVWKLDPGRRTSDASLFKLHGSVSWRRYRRERDSRDSFEDEWVGRLDEPDQHLEWRSPDDRSLILVGRFNKELEYAVSPFFDVLAGARHAICETERLVISGYSFGDKAINAMLIEWLYRGPAADKRLIIAHEQPDEVRDGARGAIGHKWDTWLRTRRLQVVREFLGSLTWADVKSFL